jgi:hypothetical protein
MKEEDFVREYLNISIFLKIILNLMYSFHLNAVLSSNHQKNKFQLNNVCYCDLIIMRVLQ